MSVKVLSNIICAPAELTTPLFFSNPWSRPILGTDFPGRGPRAFPHHEACMTCSPSQQLLMLVCRARDFYGKHYLQNKNKLEIISL